MNAPDSKFKLGLTGNQLKIIAMVAMFVGHIALAFAPDAHNVIRFGRIAFPIFAYMIAEGCTYTKNRSKYLAIIMAVAVIFHVVGYILTGSLQLSVLVSFSLAIIIIYSADTFFDEDSTLWEFFLAICGLCLVVFMTLIAPHLYEEQGYMIIYGLAGVLFPVAVYYAPGRFCKLIAAAIMVLLDVNIMYASTCFKITAWLLTKKIKRTYRDDLITVIYDRKKGVITYEK